jgi:adenosylcobinamide-phosphate synthase
VSLLAVVLALLLEQVKPRPRVHRVREALDTWMEWTGHNFDAGRPRHAVVVWCVTVAVPALAVLGVHLALASFSVLLTLAFGVAVLYATLGFRQFSHYFTDIRAALEQGDEVEARRLLAQWRQIDTTELPRTELMRHLIEHSVLSAHRHVFGVFFWAVVTSALGLGPCGAVLYRLSDYARRFWARPHPVDGEPANDGLRKLAARWFDVIDHVPARLTAFGFAIVGNFEESIAAWRRDAASWPDANDGVLLAAAAGAVGVQLGGEAAPQVSTHEMSPLGAAAEVPAPAGLTQGLPPQLGHLRSIVGLVWRSVVLWLLLLALLSLANLVG